LFSYIAEKLELKITLGHGAADVIYNKPFDPEQARVLFTRPNL
jgi:hypothetical protein